MITIGIHNPTKARDQEFTSDGKAMSSLALIDGTEQAIVYFKGNKVGAAKDMATVFEAYHGAEPHRSERLALLTVALDAVADPCRETLEALIKVVSDLSHESCCETCGAICDDAGDGFTDMPQPICPTCFDEFCAENQADHEYARDDAADHKRQLRREDAA